MIAFPKIAYCHSLGLLRTMRLQFVSANEHLSMTIEDVTRYLQRKFPGMVIARRPAKTTDGTVFGVTDLKTGKVLHRVYFPRTVLDDPEQDIEQFDRWQLSMRMREVETAIVLVTADGIDQTAEDI